MFLQALQALQCMAVAALRKRAPGSGPPSAAALGAKHMLSHAIGFTPGNLDSDQTATSRPEPRTARSGVPPNWPAPRHAATGSQAPPAAARIRSDRISRPAPSLAALAGMPTSPPPSAATAAHAAFATASLDCLPDGLLGHIMALVGREHG